MNELLYICRDVWPLRKWRESQTHNRAFYRINICIKYYVLSEGNFALAYVTQRVLVFSTFCIVFALKWTAMCLLALWLVYLKSLRVGKIDN